MIRNKLGAVEQVAKDLYVTRRHQSNNTGAVSEYQRPLFCCLFFEYFEFQDSRVTATTSARNLRVQNTRANSSLVGQQPTLQSGGDVVLLGTVASVGQEM